MTDSIRVHDGKPAGRDGAESGNPPARRRASALCPISLAALADDLRFAFGPDEETRIRDRVGFGFWQCNAEGAISTPILSLTKQ